jgi:phosphatidylglycerophosphatase A
LLTAFGLGLSPWAPGTVASLATALLVVALGALGRVGYLAALLLFAYGTIATLALAGRARRPDGGGDPGWVVSDEVAGQALASATGLAFGLWLPGLLAFVLFRAFDIGKPGPIRQLEALPGGIGVLADDLGAGVLASAGVVLVALVA